MRPQGRSRACLFMKQKKMAPPPLVFCSKYYAAFISEIVCEELIVLMSGRRVLHPGAGLQPHYSCLHLDRHVDHRVPFHPHVHRGHPCINDLWISFSHGLEVCA